MSESTTTSPHRRGRRLLAALLALGGLAGASLGGGGPRVAADAITDRIDAAQRALSANNGAMGRLRAEIVAAQQQSTQLAKAIQDLDAEIGRTEQQVNAAQAQLDEIDARLAAAEADLAATRDRLARDKHQLWAELVVMYKAQNASNLLSNLFNSGDFNSFWQHLLDVHRLDRAQQRLVGSVTAEEASISADVAAIGLEKRQHETLLATLRGMVSNLDVALAERQQAQARLAALQAADQQRLAEAEAAARELQAQIAQLQAEEAAALAAGGGSGRFAWPMSGTITQGFGCTSYPFEPYDPNCSTRHFHSGIDIHADCGTPITAADNGLARTYVSSWGFGLHVIIVHGNGWVSVYGHMSGFAIADGQTVRRGQVIGYEGSSGNSSGCHVHFEIDLNDVPQDPLKYLP